MKKTIKRAAFIAAVFLMVSISAFAEDFSAVYSANDKLLKITSSVGKSGVYGVTVNVSEYADEEPIFSPDNLPIISYLYKTDTDGSINISLPISDSVDSGKYRITLYSEDFKQSGYAFIVNGENTQTKETLKRLNAVQTAQEIYDIVLSDGATVGIDVTKDSEYLLFASKYVENHKDGDFSAESFVELFSEGIAAAMSKSGDVDGAIARYAYLFGIEISEYIGYSVEFKTTLAEYIKTADYLSKNPETVYKESLFLTKLQKAENWQKFKEIICENEILLGFSPENDSSYTEISENYRYMVFSKMYDERSLLADITQIKAAFDKAMEETYLYQKSQNPIKGSGGGSGGGYATYSTTTSVVVETDEPEIVYFSDISGHFAENAIIKLKSAQIVNGYEDGTFRPNSTITRAEFAKMLCSILELSKEGVENIFSDVAKDSWYAESVNLLAATGIVSGYNGEFMPNKNILRQDAAVMVFKALEYKGIKAEGEYLFEDSLDISDYAKTAVSALAAEGVLNGDNGYFYAKNPITRAETAVLLERIIENY